MATRLSRRKLATFVAGKLIAGDKSSDALKEVAAHLVDAKRTREVDLLVRDIEDILAEKGVVIADVTSAHLLTDVIRKGLNEFVGARSLHLRESVDETVLGGIRVDIPGKRFDGTIRRKLIALKAKQL
jgi:F0F1-type ATP synthase delta subunit